MPECHDNQHAHADRTKSSIGIEVNDPVCGMTVDPVRTEDHFVHAGAYHFCSAGCRTKFAADPDHYLAGENDFQVHPLRVRRLGIETQHEPIVYMHADCPVARSEGFAARAQIELKAAGRTALATLHQVLTDIVAVDEGSACRRRYGIAWARPMVRSADQPPTAAGVDELRSGEGVRA